MIPANKNMLWTSVVVDEFARAGVKYAVIAPGSRSTPLVMAIAEDTRIRTFSIIDERSAAFVALGLALETGIPALLVCSSGTATANFYPAIIEAHYSNVPILVLTADRPHELRDSGANQTVDQVRMYGSHVLWSVDVVPPESNPTEVVVRSLRTLANRAVAMACGPVGGPVHLNFPFRKPLEPLEVPTDTVSVRGSPRTAEQPYSRVMRGTLLPTDAQLDDICLLIQHSKRALVIAGPRTPKSNLPRSLARFVQSTGYLVLADPLSNLRWSPDVSVIGGYDTFLPGTTLLDDIDLIIHLGALPASKVLEDFFIRNSVPSVIQVSAIGVWNDPYHRLTHFIHADPSAVFEGLADRISERVVDDVWANEWLAVERRTWNGLESELPSRFFDGGIVGKITELLPENGRLFTASSLSVRHLEQFGRPSGKRLHVFCNRGASGIDGTTSSAIGVAAASPAPVVLVTGDLAFYHDLNGLLAARRTSAKLIVVLLNNDGGGIFRRLPITQFEPQFTDLFLTPHGLNFEPAAELFGFDYRRVDDYESLRLAFDAAVAGTNSVVIEVRTDVDEDISARDGVSRAVSQPTE